MEKHVRAARFCLPVGKPVSDKQAYFDTGITSLNHQASIMWKNAAERELAIASKFEEAQRLKGRVKAQGLNCSLPKHLESFVDPNAQSLFPRLFPDLAVPTPPNMAPIPPPIHMPRLPGITSRGVTQLRWKPPVPPYAIEPAPGAATARLSRRGRLDSHPVPRPSRHIEPAQGAWYTKMSRLEQLLTNSAEELHMCRTHRGHYTAR